jgi:hypothetical protein
LAYKLKIAPMCQTVNVLTKTETINANLEMAHFNGFLGAAATYMSTRSCMQKVDIFVFS